MSIKLRNLPLPGLLLLEHETHKDSRGHFARLFCRSTLDALGYSLNIRQINYSRTCKKATVRGLHFQHQPSPEIKVVTCLRGAVWDVIVDVRQNSPTFLQWHAERLSAEDGRSLILPKGCAHGFQALTDDAELLYLHTADYSPESEAGLSVTDPALAINWPLPIVGLSFRDKNYPMLDSNFEGVCI